MSLPDGVWDTYGASGWGPNGKYSLLEFDYGGVFGSNEEYREQRESNASRIGPNGLGHDTLASSVMKPQKTSALFSDESCAWMNYFVDGKMLEAVEVLYADDYDKYGWYRLKPWKNRMKACLEKRERARA